MIVGYTKLYIHREKADISFEITNEKIRLFLSMLLLSECHKLPDRKCIGRQPPILLCKQGLIQCLVIHSSVFFGIFIFVTTNNLIIKTLLSKLFLVINESNRGFLKFSCNNRTNPSYDSLLWNS